MNDRARAFAFVSLLMLAVPACEQPSPAPSGESDPDWKPGRTAAWYRDKLEESGYEITSVNENTKDYVEYEVVKGTDSYEVQIELDPETGQAQGLKFVDNSWLDDGTDAVVRRNRDSVAVPAGTRISARLNDYLDSGESRKGDSFTLTVSEPTRIGEKIVIAEGDLVRGIVTSVESAGRPQKGGRLVLKAESIAVEGHDVPVEAIITAPGKSLQGRGSFKEDIKEIGAGAAIGAVVGGLLKGGKGALAGVLIGGGGVFLATKGEQVKLPPDTELIVELRQETRFPVR